MRFRSLRRHAAKTTRLALESLEHRTLLAVDGITTSLQETMDFANLHLNDIAQTAVYETVDSSLAILPGDANQDGLFDQQDLVQLVLAGKYLTGESADWSEGDWNGDNLFDQRDLVAALQIANYSPQSSNAGKVPVLDLGSIHGLKWLDRNGDGQRDADEPGLPGVTIYLDLNHNGVLDAHEPQTLTTTDDPDTNRDETGLYSLKNARPGFHPVREVVPDGFVQTFPIAFNCKRDRCINGAHRVLLNPGDVIEGIDFGNHLVEEGTVVGGDEDVILTLPELPGFSIEVFSHSTFIRDGAGHLVQQPVTLRISIVDGVSIPPNSTPLVLQPAGVTFDPPAEVCYPNAEGLAPGDVADVFAFDHDIGQFLNIGPGKVTEDGSQICSDPGFGIVQSG